MIDVADHASLAHREPKNIAGQGRLLIVDDENVFAGSSQRLFSDEHEVTVVTSGRAAHERMCADERVHAIVCDHDAWMPGTSGLDLFAETEAESARTGRAHHFFDGRLASRRAQQFLETHRTSSSDWQAALQPAGTASCDTPTDRA
jgi:CheY-like chemotaxis protein